MSRSWILATAALISILGARSFAVEPADELKNLNAKQDKIIARLDEMINRVITLDDRVWSLQQANNGNEREIAAMKKQMETLRGEIAALRGQLGTQGSTSMSSPLSGGPAAQPPVVPPDMSVVRIRNDYMTPMDVVINGKTIQLSPNRIADVVVTPGQFAYRVVGVDTTDRVRTVATGKVFHTRIYPTAPEVPAFIP